MNVIFLTISNLNDIKQGGIYADLMRRFAQDGHKVYIISPTERRNKEKSRIIQTEEATIIKVKIPNIQKANIIEKGLSTLLIEPLYKKAINKFLKDIQFNLIIYSTPPITFNNVISYLKRKNPNAICYLLLKDIFPQNAVDIEMFSKNSLIYKYFRSKEIHLYKVSDFIGCMSPANIKYVINHNPYINPEIVEIAPNSIQIAKLPPIDKFRIRREYNIPKDHVVFVYGGNLGKPQGVDYMLRCLDACKDICGCHFIIVGNGTEFSKISKWHSKTGITNVTIMPRLSKDKYDELVRAADVGLIFLDHRFTIPNYPSRLLSYLQSSLPILACTDPNTDIGSIAQANGYGLWSESNNVDTFVSCINKCISMGNKLKEMGEKGHQFLLKNYNVDVTYQTILNHFDNSQQ